MPEKLTENQQKVFDYIYEYIQAKGMSPTVEEIRQYIGVASIRTAAQYLEALEKKGMLRRERNAKRNIRIVDANGTEEELISVPVFANVGCGSPSVLTERIFDEFVSVSNALVKKISKENLFVIRAVGNSMRDAGVNDGDFVLVEKTEDVKTGDMVVTIIDDTAVLKRLTITHNAIILDPVTSDKSYPRIIMSRDFQIFGKMIDVIKLGKNDYQVVPVVE
jgi:repressor LexA